MTPAFRNDTWPTPLKEHLVKRTCRRAALPILAIGVLAAVPESAWSQCDPDVTWTLYRPTEAVAEILVRGSRAWVGGEGGVIRLELDQVSGGNPGQVKITDVEGLVSNDVTCLAEDAFGNIWVGTKENGVTVLDANGNHVADLDQFDYLWSDNVNAIGRFGDRMVVVSIQEFSPSGTLEGGGLVPISVERVGNGFKFTSGFGPDLDVGQTAVAQGDRLWLGTGGQGLWRWDGSDDPQQVLTQADGLASNNVKNIVEAPHFDQSGRSVLWLGTGGGLQVYDPVTESLDDVPGFTVPNILDLFYDGRTMYVLTEQTQVINNQTTLVRDLYTIDLSAPYFSIRVPRATCTSDTLYVPRDVAVDGTGRIVLGTLARGIAVRDNLTWYCPPPLGPHAPQVADLHLAPSGVLYFGTGDKTKKNTRWNGLGVFDGSSWTSVTREDGIVESNVTEVHVWDDGTVWFGTTISAQAGGLDHYFPDTGAIEHYHNAAHESRRTQGRQIWSIKQDAEGNLWACIGQNGGGLSVIERPPGLRVKNYDFGQLFAGIVLLRDLAFDSRGRVWVVTHETVNDPSQLYVIDLRGTPFNLTDDLTQSYSIPNEVADLGSCVDIEIDSADRIWIAAEKGLALGEIDPGGLMAATWRRITPTASQAGGRNPLPYRVAALDWDENIWLGTEAAGLVRISRDLAQWTWFDQNAGCPLPDQSVAGIYVDTPGRTVWVGTATGGIARIDLSAVGRSAGEALNAEPFPNPWDPEKDGPLGFRNLPGDASVDVRVYTSAGELVHEQLDARGAKTWDGTNTAGFLVESGVYLVTALDRTSREVYEAKVAVVR